MERREKLKTNRLKREKRNFSITRWHDPLFRKTQENSHEKAKTKRTKKKKNLGRSQDINWYIKINYISYFYVLTKNNSPKRIKESIQMIKVSEKHKILRNRFNKNISLAHWKLQSIAERN